MNAQSYVTADDTPGPLAPPRDMSRRAFVIGGAMAAASAVAAARMPRSNVPPIPKDALDKLMPDRIGPWLYASSSGVVLPPPDALSDRLYDNLVTRAYTAADRPPLMFLIAYSNTQDGVLQVHRPEFCYPAGGYALTPTQPVRIATGAGGVMPASSFTASSPDRTEQVLYWTRVGDEFPRSWAEQRMAVVRANLRAIVPDGLLARVSVVGADGDGAMPLMQEFVEMLNRQAPARLRKVLFG